jgi:hypothetical protein
MILSGRLKMEGALSGEQIEMSHEAVSWGQEVEALLCGEGDMVMG